MPHLDAIGIVVTDMARALDFYRLLGVPTPTEWEGPHVEATLDNGLRLMFDDLELMKSLHPDWQPPLGHRMALAFACETPAEVDEVYGRVVAAGYSGKTEPWDAFWGQRYATLLDPDGNMVDLFAPLLEAAE
ncbi:glyoxalase [Armatimonadetes bacterium Uphvl-Ar2]|nr:glyoxalase [Armatimonadetes bacterium Uphvl-Ar2]